MFLAEKSGMSGGFRALGMLLFLSLPVLALYEFAAFAYDLSKKEDEFFSRAFAARLAVHAVGCALSAWVFIIIFHFPSLHLG